MRIKWAAIVASLLAIAVLATLIVSSRSVGVDDYASHYQLVNQIDQSMTHYDSMIDQLSNAQSTGQLIGSGFTRSVNQLTALGKSITQNSSEDTSYVARLKKSFRGTLDTALNSAAMVEQYQTSIATGMTALREQGPREVQRLRNNDLIEESQLFYQVMLTTFAVNSLNDIDRNEEAKKQISEAQALDLPNNPYTVSLIDQAAEVIENQSALAQSWQALSNIDFSTRAKALQLEYNAAHADAIQAAENSRILLSLFSVLLFGSLAYLVYRLQNSYREINHVNGQLNVANESLEQRVSDRTQELNEAFEDLKESQVQLVQAEKMASLGQLVAGISHEINTPLLYLQSNQTVIQETLSELEDFVDECHDKLIPKATASDNLAKVRSQYIRGLRELRQRLVDTEIKQELSEVCELNKDNIQGLEELTQMARGLKDFSRLDRAPIDSFNLNEGVERTLTIAKNILKHRVEVIKNFADLPSISCAPSQINQVLLNLITNAAQAIEDEGTITITTSHHGGKVMVSVTDTGCGISEEDLARIRDPFFTTKPVGEGTGLGLSICDEILKAHNGQLDIESREGHGATFTLTLPIVGTQINMADDLTNEPSVHQAHTIMDQQVSGLKH